MVNFLTKKTKLLNIFFYALAFYPILKFNLSSIILFGLFTIIVLKSFGDQTIYLSSKSLRHVLLFTLYFFLVMFSIIYSDDKQDALKRITRLIPLLVVPGIIICCKPNLSLNQKTKILNVFLLTNFIYISILFTVYLVTSSEIGIGDFSFSQALSNRDEFQQILDEYLGRDLLFVHKAYFSMGFVVSAVFSLQQSFINYKIKRTRSGIYIAFFLFFSFLILLVFSFPNVIALIVSIIIFAAYNLKKSKRNIISFCLIVMVTIGIVIGTSYKSENIDIKRGFNFIESFFKNEAVELNDPRLAIYTTVKSLYKKATIDEIIFGFGIGDTKKLLNDEYSFQLLEFKARNKLLFGEEFNDDYWHKNNVEVNPNILLSSKSSMKADALKEKTTNIKSSFNISRNIKPDTLRTLTFSVYAKKGSAKHLILRLGSIENRATFNLVKGTATVFDDQIKASINKEGEWYRCSITNEIVGKGMVLIGISNNKNQYKYLSRNRHLYLWGAQLEEGNTTTLYKKNKNELLIYAFDNSLNTHNTYLYFLLSGGVFCVLSFLIAIVALFYISFRNKCILQITFCTIIALNFLTENILSRHWGVIFISLMLLVFFANNHKTFEEKT